jgi:hypothetical protein
MLLANVKKKRYRPYDPNTELPVTEYDARHEPTRPAIKVSPPTSATRSPPTLPRTDPVEAVKNVE